MCLILREYKIKRQREYISHRLITIKYYTYRLRYLPLYREIDTDSENEKMDDDDADNMDTDEVEVSDSDNANADNIDTDEAMETQEDIQELEK